MKKLLKLGSKKKKKERDRPKNATEFVVNTPVPVQKQISTPSVTISSPKSERAIEKKSSVTISETSSQKSALKSALKKSPQKKSVALNDNQAHKPQKTKKLSTNPDWIDAYHENKISISYTHNHLMIAFDENGENSHFSLVVADFGKNFNSPKLRVFSNLEQRRMIALTGIPSFICKLQQATTNAMPLLAVACSDSIFIYRNFKAYHKWKLPRNQGNLPKDGQTAEFLSEEESLYWLRTGPQVTLRAKRKV